LARFVRKSECWKVDTSYRDQKRKVQHYYTIIITQSLQSKEHRYQRIFQEDKVCDASESEANPSARTSASTRMEALYGVPVRRGRSYSKATGEILDAPESTGVESMISS